MQVVLKVEQNAFLRIQNIFDKALIYESHVGQVEVAQRVD